MADLESGVGTPTDSQALQKEVELEKSSSPEHSLHEPENAQQHDSADVQTRSILVDWEQNDPEFPQNL